MSCIIHLETAGTTCSVALSAAGNLVWNKACNSERQHAKLLAVYVDEAITYAETNQLKLDAVAVSCGPGSYTGLRIGVSLAKGLCFGYRIPLIALKTTDVLIQGVLSSHTLEQNSLLCPMIDARRMEVYTCLVNAQGELIKPIAAEIITQNFLQDQLEQNTVYFFGDGAAKCKEVLQHKHAKFIENKEPLASNMLVLADKKFKENSFEDVAYFEPFYLKDFVLTESKKKFF